ncbi:MAG: hypothetical protein JWL73_3003 [Actinomycetia bacterium]|nr:hypothetical protein [Actinomycetes bacterium]
MSLRNLGRIAVAFFIGLAGYVHYRIWKVEYRHAPVREMFVANWVLSAVIAVGLVLVVLVPAIRWLGRLLLVGALLLAVGSIIAFVLSRGPGLPTFHGTFKESGLETTGKYVFDLGSAKVILVSESIAAVLSIVLLIPGRRTRH